MESKKQDEQTRLPAPALVERVILVGGALIMDSAAVQNFKDICNHIAYQAAEITRLTDDLAIANYRANAAEQRVAELESELDHINTYPGEHFRAEGGEVVAI